MSLATDGLGKGWQRFFVTPFLRQRTSLTALGPALVEDGTPGWNLGYIYTTAWLQERKKQWRSAQFILHCTGPDDIPSKPFAKDYLYSSLGRHTLVGFVYCHSPKCHF